MLAKSDRDLVKKRKADYNRSRYKKDPAFKEKVKESYRKWYAKNKKSVIERISKNRQKNHSDYLQYQKEHYRYLKYRRKYASKSG
ncbi:MAG: hypothetical protein EB150_07595 [Nitrososphaeria archaeon]|nr:hypothetical protein [Nitrososphaeria archaeon]NDB51945.1 hypothetical protein [Nitrosopumilaceae archaeon]NDB91731.1 hypothetical protein [Nitrososphaeria archaeon]NDF30046.1 hypothetical protein [Nitrososphaeria archaeon]NDF48266.1 hypothetical protein [Nitrosopumilaceae archaeon]